MGPAFNSIACFLILSTQGLALRLAQDSCRAGGVGPKGVTAAQDFRDLWTVLQRGELRLSKEGGNEGSLSMIRWLFLEHLFCDKEQRRRLTGCAVILGPRSAGYAGYINAEGQVSGAWICGCQGRSKARSALALLPRYLNPHTALKAGM